MSRHPAEDQRSARWRRPSPMGRSSGAEASRIVIQRLRPRFPSASSASPRFLRSRPLGRRDHARSGHRDSSRAGRRLLGVRRGRRPQRARCCIGRRRRRSVAGHRRIRRVQRLPRPGGKVRLDGAAVKWQFVGPVTLGVALERAGLDRPAAFELASASVRSSLIELSDAVTTVLPNSPQMVVLDEPWLGELMSPGFPIPPDEAIDRMSNAMAALPATTLTGIHCCAPCDVATLLASGPGVISVPSHPISSSGRGT